MESTLVACVVLGAFLFALCGAQVLPVMHETFVASGELEVHAADATFFGKFSIQRNQATEMGVEGEVYEAKGEQSKGVSEALYRYDMNKTYYLRGFLENPHCIVEERNFSGMPKYWGWLSGATYEGVTKIREVIFDIWGTNIGGVRFEFGVPRTSTSILYFYRRKTTELSVFYSFMSYSHESPDPEVFKVPDICSK